MSKIEDGGSAFPQVESQLIGSQGEYHTEISSFGGMSLRDYFAAKAMAANLSVIREFPDEHWRMGLAIDAYAMADAMLSARTPGAAS